MSQSLIYIDVKYWPWMAEESASAARSCLREPHQVCPMRIQKVLTDNGMVERFNGYSPH